MSNIIDFLEAIGQNANLRYAPNGEMQRMLADTKVDAEVCDAVLARDQQRLRALVGAENVCCMLAFAQVHRSLIPGIDEVDGHNHKRRA
ncbi:MAG TPA: hypothetical protein VIO59_07455 [Rhodanobacter sp.]